MSDIQVKLGGGINRIQDGIQQGKQMLQVAQEINQLKKQLQTKLDDRGTTIVRLGEEFYKKIRNNEYSSQEFSPISDLLLQYDQEIFLIQAKLNELSQKQVNDQKQCPQCQTAISSADKFCGSCGASVSFEENKEQVPMVNCHKCENQVPASATFCGCCGLKMI